MTAPLAPNAPPTVWTGVFPPDILNLIAQTVYKQGEKATLRALAQTCKPLKDRVRLLTAWTFSRKAYVWDLIKKDKPSTSFELPKSMVGNYGFPTPEGDIFFVQGKLLHRFDLQTKEIITGDLALAYETFDPSSQVGRYFGWYVYAYRDSIVVTDYESISVWRLTEEKKLICEFVEFKELNSLSQPFGIGKNLFFSQDTYLLAFNCETRNFSKVSIDFPKKTLDVFDAISFWALGESIYGCDAMNNLFFRLAYRDNRLEIQETIPIKIDALDPIFPIVDMNEKYALLRGPDFVKDPYCLVMDIRTGRILMGQDKKLRGKGFLFGDYCFSPYCSRFDFLRYHVFHLPTQQEVTKDFAAYLPKDDIYLYPIIKGDSLFFLSEGKGIEIPLKSFEESVAFLIEKTPKEDEKKVKFKTLDTKPLINSSPADPWANVPPDPLLIPSDRSSSLGKILLVTGNIFLLLSAATFITLLVLHPGRVVYLSGNLTLTLPAILTFGGGSLVSLTLIAIGSYKTYRNQRLAL